MSSVPPFQAEHVRAQPLRGREPDRVVVLRFAPFGDVVATLPVLAGLRQRLPHARIDVVTDQPFADLFRAFSGIDRVYERRPVARRPAAVLGAARLALAIGSPDVVIDLQRSGPSRLLRRLVRPAAWSAFDRFAPAHALDRYLAAVQAAGIDRVRPAFRAPLRHDVEHAGDALLRAAGAPLAADGSPQRPRVCLNPAGGWPTKNWPVEQYVALGRRLIAEWDAHILLMGTHAILRGARAIVAALGNRVANLAGNTSVTQALAIVRRLRLMVSDDSALMHLAWTQAVPTIGIFGATRSTWSRPYGEHTFCFASEDLPCGACMSAVCARGDLHCLTRVSADAVLTAVRSRGSLRGASW